MYAAETVVRIGPQRFDYRAPERFILFVHFVQSVNMVKLLY